MPRLDAQSGAVAQSKLLVALKQAAIDQHALILVFDQEFRAGDGVCGPQEADVHAHAHILGFFAGRSMTVG